MEKLIKQLEELIADPNAVEISGTTAEEIESIWKRESDKISDFAQGFRLDLLPKPDALSAYLSDTHSTVRIEYSEDKGKYVLSLYNNLMNPLDLSVPGGPVHAREALKRIPELKVLFKENFRKVLQSRIDSFVVVD